MASDVSTFAYARPPMSISARRRKEDGSMYWGKLRPPKSNYLVFSFPSKLCLFTCLLFLSALRFFSNSSRVFFLDTSIDTILAITVLSPIKSYCRTWIVSTKGECPRWISRKGLGIPEAYTRMAIIAGTDWRKYEAEV